MASRQQEKERRRAERLERERREAAAAARRRRLQLVGGGGLGALLVAGAIALAVVGLGGGHSGASQPSASAAKIPLQQVTDLGVAAKAAGCLVQNPPDEGRGHENKQFSAADYRTNPPTSGTHFPDWAQDGIYAPGNAPQLGMLVHTLEHGRIDVQYKPGTPAHTVSEFEALLGEQDGGYHMLLFENPTGMRYQVAATAWTHLLGCPRMNDKVFDALRAFRAKYIDQGPEKVP